MATLHIAQTIIMPNKPQSGLCLTVHLSVWQCLSCTISSLKAEV